MSLYNGLRRVRSLEIKWGSSVSFSPMSLNPQHKPLDHPHVLVLVRLVLIHSQNLPWGWGGVQVWHMYKFKKTRSYAALRAADLDWIIGPGYSSGGYILGENHEKPEASPPDSRLSNSRSSGEDGEPPSPSDEGDGPRRSPSPNRRAPAPPRRPHQDVPSRRTVEPVSRKKSHWLISLFVFQYHFFAKVIDWFLCLCFNIISLQNQI